MDGQTESFAAVAAAVLIPFAVNAIRCCHRNKRLCTQIYVIESVYRKNVSIPVRIV